MKIALPRKLIPPPKEKIVLPKIPDVPTNPETYFQNPNVARLLKRLNSGKTVGLISINSAFDEWLKPIGEAGSALYVAINKFLEQSPGLAEKHRALSVRIERLEDSIQNADESGQGINQSQVKRLKELSAERDGILPEKYRLLEQKFERRRQRVFAARRILFDKNAENEKNIRDKDFDNMRKRLSGNAGPTKIRLNHL